MKPHFIALLFLLFILSSSSCTVKNEICECFEIRLAIKNILENPDRTFDHTQTEAYKNLKSKKEECLTTTEPNYFKNKGLERNGRGDREFLLDELGDCEAVRKLLELE